MNQPPDKPEHPQGETTRATEPVAGAAARNVDAPAVARGRFGQYAGFESGERGAELALQPGDMVGRFTLLYELGAGGMSIVYAAYDPHLDRQVALKLMRFASAESATASLLREAQALAKVNHAHVVSVYEVGTHEREVYVAEELVRGVNLETWLKRKARRLGEILDVFEQAGRGLAAAHRANIVHRDFKPANVLIDEEGRARVADFGLARLVPNVQLEEGQDVDAKDPGSACTGSGQRATSQTSGVTFAGRFGTPAYMSPEHQSKGHADARSDQYSFCVSLYEALYGQMPFEGETWQKRREQAASGSVRPPPKGSQVPPWLRAVLLRGLRPEPEERFASMAALLEALRKDPARVRRRAILAVLGPTIVLALAIGAYQLGQHRRQVCGNSEQKLAGAWDQQRKSAVKLAFLATGVPYAGHAYGRVEQALDGYARQWVAMHTETCRATRVRGEQSEEVLDLRMSCLGQRLAELKALSDLFANADRDVLEKAAQASLGLPSLSRCDDVEALRAPTRIPSDVAVRAKVEQVRAAIARARALDEAGKFDEEIEVARAAQGDAQATAYQPVQAEATARLGKALGQAGKIRDSIKALENAFEMAVASHHDEVASLTAAELVLQVGYALGRTEDGLWWARIARMLLSRTPGDEGTEALLVYNEAALLDQQAKYDEALVKYRRAMAIDEKRHGPVNPYVACSLGNIGNILSTQGKYDEALVYHRRSLDMDEATLGPEHPEVARSLLNISNLLSLRGEQDEALVLGRRALDIFERTTSSESFEITICYVNIAQILREQGNYEEALRQGRTALQLSERALGDSHPMAAKPFDELSRIMQQQGKLTAALAYAEKGYAIGQRTLGDNNPDTAESLARLGSIHLGLGAFAKAAELLEKSLSIIESQRPSPALLGEQRFDLARALWGAKRDRQRAIELANKAREAWTTMPARKKKVAEIDAWLATHASG